MRTGRGLAWVVLAGLAFLLGGPARADDKGVVVNFSGLKSRTPASWKEEIPANKMRFAQFRLPKVKGDAEDGELVIFKGLGGSAKANIDRWKMMFLPPEGKTIDDVAKVTEIKVGETKAPFLDVKGTYKYKERPAEPNAIHNSSRMPARQSEPNRSSSRWAARRAWCSPAKAYDTPAGRSRQSRRK